MISLMPYFPLDPEINTLFLDPLNKSFLNLQAITSEEENFLSTGTITADGKGSVLTRGLHWYRHWRQFHEARHAHSGRPRCQSRSKKESKRAQKDNKASFSGAVRLIKITAMAVLFCFDGLAENQLS